MYYNILAVGVLILGIVFYYFFRDPTIFAQLLGIENHNIYSSYTIYFNSFPSFVHVFSFSIFTWLALGKSHGNSSILFWMVLNMLMEIGQLVSTPTFPWLPQFVEQYFIQGTYSNWDMLAILLGALCAKKVISFYRRVN